MRMRSGLWKIRNVIASRVLCGVAIPNHNGDCFTPKCKGFATTDKGRQIDRLVYELYGLTEEEIRIVEGEVG
jgi:hypothetical protein